MHSQPIAGDWAHSGCSQCQLKLGPAHQEAITTAEPYSRSPDQTEAVFAVQGHGHVVIDVAQ